MTHREMQLRIALTNAHIALKRESASFGDDCSSLSDLLKATRDMVKALRDYNDYKEAGERVERVKKPPVLSLALSNTDAEFRVLCKEYAQYGTSFTELSAAFMKLNEQLKEMYPPKGLT